MGAGVPGFLGAGQPQRRGDYRTWAQLLVSTGDPDRPAQACDTRFRITRPRADALYAAGYRHVGRYLFDPPGSTLDKNIKDGELEDIFAAGLSVFPIYQDNARRLVDFTFEQGFNHALNAHSHAEQYGFNRGTVIYFAVDYDATADEIASNIVPYFQGVQAGLANQGIRYFHGVYGSRNVCTQVSKNTGARYSFVSGMSWGFSGNLGFPLPPNWASNQIKEFKFTAGSDAFDLDNDAHRSGSDTGQNTIHQVVDPADAFVKNLETVFPLAMQFTSTRAGDPNRLTMEYGRHKDYGGFKWAMLIGDPDPDFIKFADNHGASVLPDFKDFVTGYSIGAPHLLAAANGHYVKPQNESDIREVGAGDISGWGGDLITLYAEWQRDIKAYPSGHAYCDAKFAKLGVTSTFGFNDLIEDADGYLIARRVQRGGQFLDVVREHYGQGERDAGALTRFRDYFEQRFGRQRRLRRHHGPLHPAPAVRPGHRGRPHEPHQGHRGAERHAAGAALGQRPQRLLPGLRGRSPRPGPAGNQRQGCVGAPLRVRPRGHGPALAGRTVPVPLIGARDRSGLSHITTVARGRRGSAGRGQGGGFDSCVMS